MKKSVSHQKYLIKRLKDPERALAYLDAALEENDEVLFLLALRNVIQARGGMTRVARKTHLSRESLYKMLSKHGNPHWKNINKIARSFGWRIAFVENEEAA